MKNLTAFCLGIFLLIFGGLACRNPLAKYTKQYNCSVPGEAEPQTSDDYVRRAYKHIELSGKIAAFEQCAFDAVSEAVRLDPQNAEALDMRGRMYYLRAVEGFEKGNESSTRSDLESSLADLSEAIRLNPSDFRLYISRSSVYDRSWFLGDTRQRVLDDLTKAAELCKDDCHSTLYQKRGAMNMTLGNYEAAVEDYTKALKLDPKERLYYEKRAEAYRKLGRNDLAEKDDATFPETAATDVSEVKTSAGAVPPSTNPKLPVPKTISGGVVNGKASNLVKPPYPPAAKAVRAAGAVNVQVTIDENGSVISASAVSGHPLLRASAVQAARASKFNPTLLSGTPVKVTGVIVYNFTPEQ